MTIFYTAPDIKRNGYEYLKANVATVHLCKDPAHDDDLATIQSKSILEAPFTSSDVGLMDTTTELVVTLNPKSGLDPSGTATDGGDGDGPLGDDIALVYVSTTKNLLAIDAKDRVIPNEEGDIVNIPAAQITVRQLKAVN